MNSFRLDLGIMLPRRKDRHEAIVGEFSGHRPRRLTCADLTLLTSIIEGATATMATAAEIEAERKRVRKLQLMMSMVMNVIGQDARMPVDEASELIASARRAALHLFPGKELAYDLIYRPRFQRLMQEKYRLQ